MATWLIAASMLDALILLLHIQRNYRPCEQQCRPNAAGVLTASAKPFVAPAALAKAGTPAAMATGTTSRSEPIPADTRPDGSDVSRPDSISKASSPSSSHMPDPDSMPATSNQGTADNKGKNVVVGEVPCGICTRHVDQL